jgi:hypothetical protein
MGTDHSNEKISGLGLISRRQSLIKHGSLAEGLIALFAAARRVPGVVLALENA